MIIWEDILIVVNPKTPYLRIYWYYINNNYEQIKPPLNGDRARDIKTLMTQVSWMIYMPASQTPIYQS